MSFQAHPREDRRTVGVLRCVLDRTISRKSDALSTGAIALSPLVGIFLLTVHKVRNGVPWTREQERGSKKESRGGEDDLHAPASSVQAMD